MDYHEEFEKRREQIFADYFTFLRFPSIATDPAHAKDVEACADWLYEYMKGIGLQVELWRGKGAPTLFGSDLRAGPSCETVLLYGHYDVQPVDPLELWDSPPFEPTLRKGAIYARGAVDDKGQVFYALAAIRALLEKHRTLPFNLKVLIEGEEESGSTHLGELLSSKKAELKADHLLLVDGGLPEPHTPAIILGCRGIVTMTVTLTAAKGDMHSGTHGGIALNPNRALAQLLATLHTAKGRVAIPHFYDHVAPLTEEEMQKYHLEFNPLVYQEQFGAEPLGMEEGFSPLESSWLRPTLEINGISGGYQGPGFKTVIPARAEAKLSCRLVPSQDPEQIGDLVKKYLFANVPKGVNLKVEIHPGLGKPFRTSSLSRIASVMQEAYTEIFHKPCKRILAGGSIPIAVELAEAAEAEMLLIGTGLITDQIHAPNEHFEVARFKQGFLVLCNALERLGAKTKV